jgi:hypothetical protein
MFSEALQSACCGVILYLHQRNFFVVTQARK